MNRSRHSVGPQRANGLSWSRGLFTVARLAFLLIAIFAPLSSSLSSVATEDSTVEVGTRFSLRAPLISKLNEVLTSLWTQITHNGEPVEISGSKAQELVETTIRRLRDSGEEVPDEFRDLLLWQLTSCFPIDENALRGIHGIFGVTSRVVCPANRTFSCALSALNIPLAEEERTPIQALEASICAAAIRHVGHDAAARLASQRGTGLGPEQVRNLTLEETSLSTTDEKTERLFIEGIQLQIEMQKGFQQLQWSRFGRAFKLASAFRLAQRLFYEPQGVEGAKAEGKERLMEGSPRGILQLVDCVAKSACFGIGEQGFRKTVEACVESERVKSSSVLEYFFRVAPTKKDSVAAQVFATSLLVLDSTMQGRRLVASQGTPALGELPEASSLSSLQQAVAVSVAACSAEVMESFDSHLQALGSLEAISSSPVLFASVALENAPLLFALSGVQSPESLQSEYEKLRQTGSALGLALVRGASKMIGTACGKEGHLAAPSSSYLACVSNSLENIAWKAQRALLKQHLNALAYFAEKPDLLPEGPDFSEALRNFTASATKLVQTLRKAAGVSNGALDLRVDRGRISLLLDDALRQFGRTLQDNLLPMGVTFLEDGELSLYGPTIYEKIVSSTSEASRQAPSSGGGGELKSFMIMQRLRGHLNEVIGNESLRRAYTSTANKTGLSSRAVESTFIKSQARHIFIFIQSLLDSRSEDVTTRFSTAEGLHSFIIEFLAEKVAKKEPEEEKSSFGGNVSGEVVALASSVNKEVLRIFAKRISLSSSFQKAKQAAGMNVSTWLKSEFADFRKDIPPSYVIDIAYECLNRCTIPMLADTRLQTQCTDSQGRPQPLGKCADPAAEFQRIISKEMWANFLEDWMTQGKAHSACRELLVLQEEDASAWQRQVFLMYSHLDSIGCGKDHHGYDSFGRYSIKLEMIQNLFEMFASTAKFPTLANFINWLVKLREPLPQDLQTPTALALQYAGGYPQTQVRVSKAFAMAVKGDPSYSQCKPEDTKIISELLGSLGSVFYTLQAFDDFIKERRTGKENITRQVTAPVAADARPVLSQLMLTFTATGPRAPDAVIRYPAYVPSSTAALLSQSGAKAMQVFVYIQDVLGNVSATQLTSSDETGHLLDAALATEAWTVKCLGACNSSCTLRSEGEQAISMSISTTAVAPYTFPATDDESLAAAVFGWLLPSFPALRCKAPTRKVIPVVLPIPPPTLPPIPEPSKEVEVPPKPEPEEKPFPPPPPTAPEEIVLPPPEEKVPEIPEAPVVPIPPKQISIKKKKPEIDIKKNENKDATEPEEMITMIPPKTEEAPKLEPKEDACLKVVRLYNKYIQGAEIKDVKTLHEEAMAVPLYRETRKELQIDQKDISMQQFRLALCVTCAKHIPALQLASGEEQQRLAASIEMSKDICASVYKKTLWANEIDGGAPLASATPASLLTKSVQLNLQAAAISHRLLGGAQPLLQAAEKEATAVEVCAAGEVLGRSLQNAKCIILRRNPDISSPFLLALGGLSRAAAKKMRFHKECSKIAAELSSIFGASVKVAGRRVSPTSLAGGLRNWLSQDMGLAAWAKQAHKKLKSDRSVAALCAALRYAEFIRQISSLGTTFDRMLSHWNLSLPSNGLSLVNALRSASNPKQKLTQELCVLTPPGQEVQRLVQRFDPAYWAALMLQTGEQGEAAAGAAAPAAESARSTEA